MRLPEGWAVFVVRKIIAPHPQPLSRVRSRVVAGLEEQRKHEVSSAFANEFSRRWIAKTSCEDGYVVPGCKQFGGPLGTYEDPFAGI
jgi:hypothetical protein